MPEVHAVEGADRDRAAGGRVGNFDGIAKDLHDATPCAASTTAGFTPAPRRSYTASNVPDSSTTANGPGPAESATSAGDANVAPCAIARARSASATTVSRSRTASAAEWTRGSGSAAIVSSVWASSAVNGPTRQAAQVLEMRAASERAAEIRCKRSDIGAARTVDEQRRLRERTRFEVFDLERIDAHRARFALDLDAFAGQLVQLAPADLDGGDHRWHLFDIARERGQGPLELLARDRHLGAFEHRARCIERIGGDTEHDPRPIGLARFLQEPQQTGHAPEADEQHAGCVGIERARVPDALLAVDPAQLGDDVVARPTRLLVDHKKPVAHHARPTRVNACCATIGDGAPEGCGGSCRSPA